MEPKIDQVGEFISFVEKVTDTAEVTVYRVRAGKWPKVEYTERVYRVRAGKWPKVEYTERPTDFPDPATPDLHPYNTWSHGAATLVLSLYEDRDAAVGGRVLFFDAMPPNGEWIVSTRKRCVWVVLLKRIPVPFTGHE